MSVVLHPALTLTPHTFRLPDAIRELGERPHWLVWRYIHRNHLRKPTKLPVHFGDPTRNASTANAATWTTLAGALDAWGRFANQVNGIGYVLSHDADLVMVDLDDCRNPQTGALTPFAEDLVRRCRTYVEVTPSQTGLRIIGRAGEGYLPSRLARALKLGGGEAPDKVELYRASNRYVTVTGWELPGRSNPTLGEIGHVIAEVLSRADVRDAYDPDQALSAMGAMGMPEDLRAALRCIPNEDLTWEDWNKVGMAIWAAFGGAEEGLEWFRYWSAKSVKHTDEDCYERWDNYHRSPPDRLSAGTLIHMARKADPNFRLPSREVGATFAEAPLPHVPAEQLRRQYPGIVLSGDEGHHGGNGGAGHHVAAGADEMAAQAATMRLLDIDELESTHGQKPEFMVEGYLPRGATVLCAGIPGAGKSPLAQAWAVSVALGVPWAGMEAERGHVLYVAAESPNQTAMNLVPFGQQAIAAAMGPGFGPTDVPADEVRGMLRGRLLTMTHSFALERDTAGLIAAVEVRGRLDVGWAAGPDVVVLDTLRAITGGSSNKDEDMAVVQHAIAHIRARWPRCCIVVLHHAPKGDVESSSGSNRLDGMGDVILTIAPMRKGGAPDDDKAVVGKADRFGPCAEGWMYTQARVVMQRNKVWHVARPMGVLMQTRENTLWMRWGQDAAGAAQKGNGGPFGPVGAVAPTRGAGGAAGPAGEHGGGGHHEGGAEAGEAGEAGGGSEAMGFASGAGGMGIPVRGGGLQGTGDTVAEAYRIILAAMEDRQGRSGPEVAEVVAEHPEAAAATESVRAAIGLASVTPEAGRHMLVRRLREMADKGMVARTGTNKGAKWVRTA